MKRYYAAWILGLLLSAQGASAAVLATVNGTNYRLERVSEYIVEITNVSKPLWNVDKLIVDVKNSDGVKVYPTISTINSKITIYFNDGLLTNYNVIFI